MHPALRILALVLLAILIQHLVPTSLLLLGTLAVSISLGCYGQLLIKTLRKSRWLLLTLLVIYAWTTPGEYVQWWPFDLAPTYEGLIAGVMQSGRLVTMLAGLTLLLGSTGREGLMSGIYALLQPLSYLGVSAQRFTARLWLTLDYAEQPRTPMTQWWALMNDLDLVLPDETSAAVVLNIPAFTVRDGAWLLIFFCTLIWTLL